MNNGEERHQSLRIQWESPESPDAVRLMDELSNALQAMTGSSGRGSFDPKDVQLPKSAFVIARTDSGEPQGCGAFRPMDEGTAEVKRMYARSRATGVGTAILAYLEKLAKEMGYKRLCLETRLINERAVSFYERRGYERIPNYGKYAGRPESVCFVKELSHD